MKEHFKSLSLFAALIMVFAFSLNVNAQVEVFDDSEPIFVVAEESPEFPGGDTALHDFLVRNIKYPNTEGDWKGKIFLSFIIEKDGSLTNIKVIRGLSAQFDEEAIRVVKLMPKWTPAKQRGKAVRQQFTLPVSFALPMD